MDIPSPRPRSVTPYSGSGHQIERPLPRIPDPELPLISWDNEGVSDVPGSSDRTHNQELVDTSGVYSGDVAAEGQGIDLHGVDESLLDIYRSRSSSSLSVYENEQLTRSPYLEGVSNHSPRPSFVIDDNSTSQGESPELLRSSRREGTGASVDLRPVSLREFLGDSASRPRNGSPMLSEAPAMSSKSAVDASTSTGDSVVRSRGPQARPQGALWQQSEPRSNASLSVRTPTRTPRRARSRPPDDDDDSSGSLEDSPLLSHTSPSQIRRRQQAPAEFVVPRWQPDAEVTFCPICRTQFSFFVRKHHCRKCGRVVCNSCSPHRIVIPYQYIVQPPTDSGGSPTSSEFHPRPRADTAGSSGVTSLGGERVRLCNPCVPDPNTAPPANTQRPASNESRHSRSASTTAVPQNTPPGRYQSNEAIIANIGNFPRRPRQSSILGNTSRYSDSQNQSRETSYNERRDGLLRPDGFQSRSRSSTVGSFRDQTLGGYPNLSNPNTSLERSHSIRGHPQHRSLIPNVQPDQYPTMDPRPRPAPRRQIAEADECWICHIELPSRDLPDFQALREAHTKACLDAAIKGVSLSPVPASHLPPPQGTSPSQTAGPSQERPGLASSSFTPVPVANTSEARTAAREQAHAAIVLGQNRPSPGPRRLNGGNIFPYKASEKDLIQDAECSICFEEYVVGQDMGRLECFCRFHLQCIRGWYSKEPGRCPMHDHIRDG